MAGLANSSKALQQWHRLFESRAQNRTREAHQHLQQVLNMGLPSRKHEDWKYTPLEGLIAAEYTQNPVEAVSPAQCDGLALPGDYLRLIFINGVWSPALSDDPANSGYDVTVSQKWAGLPAPLRPEVFLHLTESLAQQVTWVRVARNQQPARPLVLMHITSSSEGSSLNTAHYRHHLTLEQGAAATVIEHFVSLDQQAHLTGGRLTMDVADNARLQHYKLAFENAKSFHFAHNDIQAGRDTQVASTSFLLGAGVLRHHTSTRLQGENTQLNVNSLALPVNNEVCDTRTWLSHDKGYCNSRQLHKTIVRDKGRAVFNGQITVAKHAIKTDGQMTNNNLLLGRLAEVDTKPQLEIYADDVKCSHGATIGRIDDDQMFYLRARGIDEQAAQRMIIYAFAAELTESIEDETLRQQVLARIGERFTPEGV